MNPDNRNRPGGVQTAEHRRLEEASAGSRPWKKWGPYLSERQWGTVREDFSENGDAWNDFSHDQARSRTYRWGEDGLAGTSDDRQTLCLSLALWNGQDSILILPGNSSISCCASTICIPTARFPLAL